MQNRVIFVNSIKTCSQHKRVPIYLVNFGPVDKNFGSIHALHKHVGSFTVPYSTDNIAHSLYLFGYIVPSEIIKSKNIN